ncbi:hypothetical protein Ddye_027717 [Dipteronia dyeriana]|uniref:Cytochrome P450 n=1 Tax=Dipteronia dyeriana TaxID=168575 RepID=A0AAD9TPP7_9ROSI|nr:hypothetical protein Ddye_027717 [Dipteronia dyeriana]
MELQFLSSTVIFGFFIFMFMAIKIVHPKKAKSSSTKMPPRPWRLPLIGNIHQLVGSPPHHRLRDLAKKYGPLMHLQLGESSIIVVSSAEIAEEVLKTHGIIFANRPSLVSTKLTTYDFKDILSLILLCFSFYYDMVCVRVSVLLIQPTQGVHPTQVKFG